jgi:D-cysteine desulfhydrase
MTTPYVFQHCPKLESTTPFTSLIAAPTPVAALAGLGKAWKHPALFVKREDATSSSYGGNKVRNLEFILGHALASGAKQVVTVAPRGSNFVAALSAQAASVKMAVEVAHFTPATSLQIDDHARFSEAQGSRLRVFHGNWGVAQAALYGAQLLAKTLALGGRPYFIAPGGSSARGALGHVNAALECVAQARAGEMPIPDVVVVGAGTCGTMAGLLVGFRLAGVKTRVIGVRCVDRIVCNRRAIARMANAVARLVGIAPNFRRSDVDLRDTIEHRAYGITSPGATELIKMMKEADGITLDTTYTAKVVSKLREIIGSGEFSRQAICYWHTFSDRALRSM